MKKSLIIIPLILALGISAYAGYFYYKHLRGVKPALSNPPYPIEDVVNQPGSTNPLEVPSGFSIEVFAKDLSGARVLLYDRYSNFWVSRPKEGKISVVMTENGQASRMIDVATGLDNPHGLLFDIANPNRLYIAEEDRISSVDITYNTETGEPSTFTHDQMTTLVTLNAGTGSHYTRSLAYGPDQELLVSIGSSCNVCDEESSVRASIQELRNVQGTWTLTPYATGLRNSVFMDLNPVDGKLWATEMGRDLLGDNIPPDELNIIEKGKNYGWPVCYGNRIHDVNFDTKQYIVDPCASTVPSYYDFPAHVAPLGLAFIPEESFWPEEYWNNLLVAYHGSWNRSVPVGYMITRFVIDNNGQIVGEQPFIEGWLTKKNEALGRPVDLVFMNGDLYITDDHAGVIYRVRYGRSPEPSVAEEPTVSPADMISVDGLDEPGVVFGYDTTQATITLFGRARGTMFFEASFPVVVTDDIGTIVAQGIATANGDWMTEDFVPFTAVLTKIDDPTTPEGKVTFSKDNPSGLPEHDWSVSFDVTFTP